MANLLQITDSLEVNELHRTVQDNRLEAVKFLIKSGADVAYPINKYQTPLYIAVKNDYRDITEVLCKSMSRDGVRSMIDRKMLEINDTGILHLAAKNNSLESTRFLLSCGANFEIRDKESRRIQDLTTDESIEELAKSIDEVFELTKKRDNQALRDKLASLPVENVASVMYARNEQSATRSPSLPAKYCRRRTEDRAAPQVVIKNRTALQMAMESFDAGCVETIANFRIDKLKQNDWQAGADIDKLVQRSKAARRRVDLHVIRWQDRPRAVVDLLHDSFAFLEAYKEQGNLILENQPLLVLIEEALEFFEYWKGSIIMEEWIQRIVNADAAYVVQMLKLCVIAPMLLFMRSVYTSELLEAAKQNDSAKVEKYLTGHPDLNETDESNGWTALHHAIDHKNENIAKLLLQLGADPTIAGKHADRKGSPLHMALQGMESRRTRRTWSSPEVLTLLFENVSDDKLIDYVNARTERESSTPLHLAVRQNNLRLVEFLLRRGCVYCSRDASNNTHGHYSGDEAISNLLKRTESSFARARDGEVEELVEAARGFDKNTLLAVGGARDEENRSLVEVLDLEGHADEAGVVRKLLADARECK